MQTVIKAHNLKKILVVRNDKLGDLLVSFSTFATLKKNLPNTEIHVLVSKYTAPMAELCEFIDHVIIDPASRDTASNSLKDSLKLVRMLKKQRYEVIITLFSTLSVAFAAYMAKIPIRIAPATKIGQIFYNYRIKQRRSRSEKPEHRYNQELAEYLLSLLSIEALQTAQPPFLKFKTEVISQTKQDFIKLHNIPNDHLLVYIHPGTGGSARNLSEIQFAQLANFLQENSNQPNNNQPDSHSNMNPITIIISFGPNEEHSARKVYENINKSKVLYASKLGLENFSQHLSFADCFISGSTGPLHIAGVLDRPTAAFYTRRRSATSLRWQTLNTHNNRLAFSPPNSSDAEDMTSIDIEQAANEISSRFLQIKKNKQ